MEKMIVVVFDTQPQAYDGILSLWQLDREGTISVHSGSVIKKNSDGATELLKTREDFPVGVVEGTAIGSLIGLLGGPVGVLVGATSGTFLGAFHNLYRSGVSAEFVEDVSAKLGPGKFALVADINEEWITPLDIKMEKLGGQVFRTRKQYVEIDQAKAHIAALNLEIKQLEAEMKEAKDERKAILKAKIDKLKEKRQEKTEQTKLRLEQINKENDAKIQALKEKAAKAKAEQKAAIEAQVDHINEDYQETLAKLRNLEAERLGKKANRLEKRAKQLRSR